MSENAVASGNAAKVRVVSGFLREYSNTDNPLELHFEFNPTSISRTRSIDVNFGDGQDNSGGLDFNSPDEASRVTQGATVKAESFTVKILLDATDRMNAGDDQATKKGVQPELDILYYMVEPKLQAPNGATTLAALGEGADGAQGQTFPSILEFHWGEQVLPVLMTQFQFDVKAYLPSLLPYRAEATLTLRIIQSRNKLYMPEINRIVASVEAATGTAQGFQSSEP